MSAWDRRKWFARLAIFYALLYELHLVLLRNWEKIREWKIATTSEYKAQPDNIASLYMPEKNITSWHWLKYQLLATAETILSKPAVTQASVKLTYPDMKYIIYAKYVSFLVTASDLVTFT